MLLSIDQSGAQPAATMSKNELKSVSVVSQDPVFSLESNWSYVAFIFAEATTKKRIVATFKDFAQPRAMRLLSGMTSGNQFSLKKILIVDQNKNFLALRPSTIPSAASYDFTLSGGGPAPTPQFAWANATKLSDPVGMGTADGRDVKFSPSGNLMLVILDHSPYAEAYAKNGDTLTKLATPSAYGMNISFSGDGSLVALGASVHSVSGTTLTYRGGMNGGMGAVAVSKNGQYLACQYQNRVHKVYKYENNNLTELNVPTMSSQSGRMILAMGWSHNDRFLYVVGGGGGNNALLVVYERTGDTFTQVAFKYLNTSLGNQIYSMTFNSDESVIYLGGFGSLGFLQKTGDTTWTELTPLSGSSVGMLGYVQGLALSPQGKYLLATHEGEPGSGNKGATIFSLSTDGLTLTKVNNPFPSDVVYGAGCDWSDDGQYIAAAQYMQSGLKNAVIFKNG